MIGQEMINMIPSVTLLGIGSIGSGHYKTLRVLEDEGKLKISAVYDANPEALKKVEGHKAVSNLEDIPESDIVAICTNAKTHYDLIEQFRDRAVFVEKPVVETVEEAITLQNNPPEILGVAYLMRFSGVVEDVIKHLQGQQVENIEVAWKKLRAPTRPVAGIHIDETTHALDLLFQYILPSTVGSPSDVTLQHAKCWRSPSVVDIDKQRELYGEDSPRMNPLAQISYSFDVDGIPISGFSSYMSAPKKRTIEIDTGKFQYVLDFDADGADVFRKFRAGGVEQQLKGYSLENVQDQRVYKEWEAFLEYFKTGVKPDNLAGIEDAVKDVHLTSLFEGPSSDKYSIGKTKVNINSK